MKLHILETFTDGHVLDPKIYNPGDNVFINDGSGRQMIAHKTHRNDQIGLMEITPKVQRIATEKLGFNVLSRDEVEEWLNEQQIPQNPNEWDEEMHFRFQLRFG